MAKKPQPGSDPFDCDAFLSAAPMMEGFRVLDPAVLYAKIGEGGMGAVYRGWHCTLDLDVAVKCLRPELALSNPDFIRRFEREAKLAASITHQNVVRVMHVQQKNGIHYLVMEFVAGETALARSRRKGPLAEREAIAIITGAAAGLAEAHSRGIVHRDIKPENIMISTEGRVKLADLGLAKATGASVSNSMSMHTSVIMGTPTYMPPEQWDTPDVGPTADIWALGATMFCLLAGRGAFSGALTAVMRAIQGNDFPTLRKERPDLRPEVHELFERCVRRLPAERFTDAKELLKALRSLGSEDEAGLVDLLSGSTIPAGQTVTPPPRNTLLRIRAKIEQERAEESGDPTMPTRPTATWHSRWPMLVACVLVVGAAVVWAVSGLGDGSRSGTGDPGAGDPGAGAARSPAPNIERRDPVVPENPPPANNAATALAEGQKSLDLGELDVAIAQFMSARKLDDSAAALAGLVATYVARGERRVATDLDAALADLREAVRLLPGDAGNAAKAADVERAIQNRMLQGLVLTSPDPMRPLPVQASREIALIGDVRIQSLKDLQIAITNSGSAPGAERWQSVKWPGGIFRRTETASSDGSWFVHVRATDLHDLQVSLEPTRVVVDTEAPRIEWRGPEDGAMARSPVSVAGRVVDLTACTVKVNQRAVGVEADGTWQTSLELDGGEQTIVVDAEDAAGLPASERRTVRVDVDGPDIRIEPVAGSRQLLVESAGDVLFTRQKTLRVEGVVSDEAGVGSVRFGDESVAVDGEGRFGGSIEAGVDTATKVTIVAEDRLGLRSEVVLRARRVTAGPRITVTSPTNDAPVAAGDLEVTGRVVAAVPGLAVDRVTVAETTAIVDRATGTFRALVPLRAVDPGRTAVPIALSAEDELGNVGQGDLRVQVVVLGPQYTTANGLRLIRVKAADFTMGSSDREPGRRYNEGQVEVSITQDFWLGETEVPQRIYQEVMKQSPWLGSSSVSIGADVAAACITWADAVDFCRRLTAIEQQLGNIPPGHVFALPTEAQWELACRAGRTGAFCYGDESEKLGDYAVYAAKLQFFDDRAERRVERIRTKRANAWGFYDMHGNVLEWCADVVPDEESAQRSLAATAGRLVDPVMTRGTSHVLRGGSYFSNAEACRSACRKVVLPTFAEPQAGLRAVLVRVR